MEDTSGIWFIIGMIAAGVLIFTARWLDRDRRK